MKKAKKIVNRKAYGAYHSVMRMYTFLKMQRQSDHLLLGMHPRNKVNENHLAKVLISDFFADVEIVLARVYEKCGRFDQRLIGIAFLNKRMIPIHKYFITIRQRR